MSFVVAVVKSLLTYEKVTVHNVALESQQNVEIITGINQNRKVDESKVTVMSYPRPHPGVLRRNILLSLTLMIAISIVASTFWLQASEINLKQSSKILQGIEVVLFSLMFLFNAILFGSIAEYYKKEVNLLVIVFSLVFPLLVVWGLGIFDHEKLTYAILGGMGVMTIYLFVSASSSTKRKG